MKKYLLTTLLLLALIMTMIACRKSEDAAANDSTDVENAEYTTNDNNMQSGNEETATSDTTSETNDDTAETEETTEPNEPAVEMVSWEEWATQADNDEVCLVVWNDKTGTQKILEPVIESGSIYTVEEGDRFAIPKRKKIDFVLVGYDTKIYPGHVEKEYIEVDLPVGQEIEVHIACAGEKTTTSYWFNY